MSEELKLKTKPNDNWIYNQDGRRICRLEFSDVTDNFSFVLRQKMHHHFVSSWNTRHAPDPSGVVEAGQAWQKARADIAHKGFTDIGAEEYDRVISARKRFDAELKAYKIHIGDET